MSGTAQRRAMYRRRAIATLALFGVIALGVIYGPRLASGNYHRAAIERLASSAIGRRVRITGLIELALVPDPQLRAETVTIGGPRGAVVTAQTLKLDLAPWPLLLGRLRARRLTLRKPQIDLPWPLPGGAQAVAPPLWLASLHATIEDGTLHLGSITFTHADLSIFTGGPNAVLAASGSVEIAGQRADVTLDIDDTGSSAPAPVTADITLDDRTKLGFRGTLDRDSILRGAVTAASAAIPPTTTATGTPQKPATLPPIPPIPPFTASARLVAENRLIDVSDITATVLPGSTASATQKGATLQGHAVIALAPAPLLRLDLAGTRASLNPGTTLLAALGKAIPTAASLNFTSLTLHHRTQGTMLGPLHADILADRAGVRLATLDTELPGKAHLLIGRSSSHGSSFALTAPAPAATIEALRPAIPYLPRWPSALGPLTLGGTLHFRFGSAIRLDDLHGQFGGGKGPAATPASAFTGSIHLFPARNGTSARVATALAFQHLRLTPRILTALIAARGTAAGLNGPFALSAGQIDIDPATPRPATPHPVKPLIAGTHLVIEGALRPAAAGGGVALRLVSIRLGHAVAIGHGTVFADGAISAARLMMSGPDATATLQALGAAMMPHDSHAFAPPWLELGIWHHRFALAIAAAGTPARLHAGIALHLGAIRAAATPLIDLIGGTATGPISLHAPQATALLHAIGATPWLEPANGAEWPGPGSVSLRASGFATRHAVGLPDFMLSFAGSTASGQVAATLGPRPQIVGSIAADTLIVPDNHRLLTIADAALGGKVDLALPVITAHRLVQRDHTVARDLRVALDLHAGDPARILGLTIAHASALGGTIEGAAALTGPASGTTPLLSITGHLTGADAPTLAAIARANGVSLPLTAGTLDLAGHVIAKGTTPHLWMQSLTGSLTGSGQDLGVTGIDLAATGSALAHAISSPTGAKGALDATPADLPELATALTKAATSGKTTFASFTVSARIAGSVITLTQADLAGTTGKLDLSGTIDLAHRQTRLTARATPAIAGHKEPPVLTIGIDGSPAHPRGVLKMAPAITWISSHKPAPPAP
ncbi:AsmA family protein [Acidiphilium acidophilum]|uniref:AsmA-like C-terminal region-containing protein n=1 Tax=Acidiphilium acidophilum TaxID=76588 RepID=A0AAW9DRZ3_ACIAO|nr:AsmA-like C-terminal region-containing protein [Acidiphilium acidophilum]MDX5931485.1 AsmA-like C-terminal region-containing protein [Acidiphilium acidophilum]